VNETWIIPHAWFKLGQALEKQEKLAEARAAFNEVRRFDNYDFQERLEKQVTDAITKLEARVPD
jgi:hypothetical protein